MCQANRAGRTIAKYGCALASMSMLYGSYGFGRIPDENHHPLLIGNDSYLNLETFNNYLSKPVDPTLIFSNFGPTSTRGFNSNYDIDWLKTTSTFYYSDIYFLNNDFNIRPYHYVVPNYDCTPINIQYQKKNGSFQTVTKSASCFMVDWTSPEAMAWLDYDIQNNENPPIMKVEYHDRNGIDHIHFVVVAGYDPTVAGDGGCAR